MKKMTAIIMSVMLMTALAACGAAGTQAPVDAPGNQAPTPSSGSSQEETSNPAASEESASKADDDTLVIYFSATGNTKVVAQAIAKTAEGELYEIVPEEPYTAADLNWKNENSRVSVEHNDPNFRPAIAGELPDLSGYKTVFIGYPSWWGDAPNIVRTLMESVDLAGKTVIPFCTSSSSGIGTSGETLAALTSGATWLEGQRFSSGADEAEVSDWVNGLKI